MDPRTTLLDNPLLAPWRAPFGLPPFEAITPAHFAPALHEAMRVHRAELDAIAADARAPDFDNTVAAFDRCGRLLARVEAVFHNLSASATSPALQAVQRELAAPMAAHYSAVYMHQPLFARIDGLHAHRADLGLDGQALRLLERVHLDFVRAGARLEPEPRARYAQLMQRLAELHTAFAQNVLHDEAAFRLPLTTPADFAGLPEFVRAAARQAAAERGVAEGGVITLARSLIVPFLSFSTRRDLREQAWRAWAGRGEHAGAHDNRPIVREILALRAEQAALHGCANYADYALVDTMAGDRAAVHALLEEVWPRALAALARERDELIAVQRQAGGLEERSAAPESLDPRAARAALRPGAEGTEEAIEPWDWRFLAEQVRQRRYALDDAEIKPYFALERVVQAAFDCAGRLFGLRFVPRTDLPVYHPDVRAYEVQDAAGATVAVFLQDNYARPNKRSGAWMSSLRQQSRNEPDGRPALPVVLNNNNFAKGAPGAPALLSLDDARTLFHEFGHGLHGMLSDVRFERLAGTEVLRDFVELPSQLFEHWLTEPAVLKAHARHWQTDEPIPDELIARMRAAQHFNQGYETVRYAASALLDLRVHSLPAAEVPADPVAWEAHTLQQLGLPPGVGLNHRLVHFQHLFSSSGYAAGYYVYLWAEVLDADGFEAFREAGDPFDPALAAKLRRHIYAAGNSVEPGAAYAAFRGRAPVVEPLLRKRGLVPELVPELVPAPVSA